MDHIFKRATKFLTEKGLPKDTITINNFPSNLKLPMKETSGSVMNKRIKNIEDQIEWRKIVKLTINEDSITISTAILFKILMNSMNLNEERVKEVIGPLLRNYLGVEDQIMVYGLLIRGKKEEIFNYLPNILQMMVFMQYKANQERYEHFTTKTTKGVLLLSTDSNAEVSPFMQGATAGTKLNALIDTQLFRGIYIYIYIYI